MMRVKKIKNVLPLLHFDYRCKVLVKQWQDGQPVKLGSGSVRSIIAEFGDKCIVNSMLLGNALIIYVED